MTRFLLLLKQPDGLETAAFAARVIDEARGLGRPCRVYVPDDALDAVKNPFPRSKTFDALLDADSEIELADCVAGYEVDERHLKAADPPPALVLVSLVCRAPALAPAAFDAHWRDRHGPLALRHHVGMSDYRQDVVVARLDDSSPPFDGVALLGFPSPHAFETQLFDSREGRRLIGEDTARFVDVARTELRLLREVVP